MVAVMTDQWTQVAKVVANLVHSRLVVETEADRLATAVQHLRALGQMDLSSDRTSS